MTNRVGAWDYLKYGHISPIEEDGKNIQIVLV
jgi:hypothetical protein